MSVSEITAMIGGLEPVVDGQHHTLHGLALGALHAEGACASAQSLAKRTVFSP